MAGHGRFMSQEYFDFICTACERKGKVVEAVRYCIECGGYCCQVCTDIHTTFPTLNDHNLLDASQGNQASNQPRKLPEFPIERCDQHRGKVVDMYCEEHNEVGCYICISAHYKSCPEKRIYSVPDLIDKLFKLRECKQIQSRLTDVIVSLNTLGKSKDDILIALKCQKNEEIEKVIHFQKALESLIREAGETSRNAIENKYKELEKEIIEEKHDVEKTENNLKKSDEKLKKSEGNRAQRFVSSKIAEKKMIDAEKLLSKRNVKANDGKQVVFTKNQLLMTYLSGLQGIGMVSGNRKKKTDLYKITGIKDINIKQMNDSRTCRSNGCCLTYDNQLLVTDFNNYKLKLIDTHTMTVIDNCKLDSQPFGVCFISDHEAAVACSMNKIQLVTYGKMMTPSRQFKTSHFCYGITTKDDKLYVTNNVSSLYIYDMTGKLLKTISQDNAENKLFANSRHVTFNENGDKMYVGNWKKGIVSFDGEGKYQSTFNDRDLSNADGVCVDGSGNLFVVGYGSHNVVQFTEDGKKIGVVIKQQDGLQHPHSVCFHQGLNRLYVTMQDSDVVKMFELQ